MHALSAYVAALAGHPQKYILQNRLRTPESRNTENVEELCALFVDLDFHKVRSFAGWSAERVMAAVVSVLDEVNAPAPSLIVDSGRGLQVIWLIEPVPASAELRSEHTRYHQTGRTIHPNQLAASSAEMHKRWANAPNP